ncbi:WXG100 family type VII secretion target [Streptomyces sp. PSKA30]|uniref:WXG100 family type VII secretion target n=1 Tax=Streptomyces sp. PSKA30 TaxID=2874597 RepID=UPI001CD04F77|nr:hypothetical protein [Streptomyces sp. PSKA30]MBZ9641077.1 hypothetical protein [Streptomyces sp. PSKA30]
MTTPPGTIAGDSGENARAIQRLTEARDGIRTNLDGIDGQMGNLGVQYRGVDGMAYGRLLLNWHDKASKIMNDLTNIIEKYGENSRLMSQQVADNEEAVASAHARNILSPDPARP